MIAAGTSTPELSSRGLGTPRHRPVAGDTPSKSRRALQEIRIVPSASPITAGKVRRRRQSGAKDDENSHNFSQQLFAREMMKDIKLKLPLVVDKEVNARRITRSPRVSTSASSPRMASPRKCQIPSASSSPRKPPPASPRTPKDGTGAATCLSPMRMQKLSSFHQDASSKAASATSTTPAPSLTVDSNYLLTLSPAFLQTASALVEQDEVIDELERKLLTLDADDDMLDHVHSGLDKTLTLLSTRSPPPFDTEEEIVGLRTALTAEAGRVSALERALKESALQKVAAAQECQAAEEMLERVCSEREELQEEATSLRMSLDGVREGSKAAERDVERLRGENSDLRCKLQNTVAQAGEDCVRLKGEVAVMSAQCATLNAEMEKMRGEAMAAGGHEALLRETMARLARSKVCEATLKEERDNYQEEIARLTLTLQSRDDEMLRLKQEAETRRKNAPLAAPRMMRRRTGRQSSRAVNDSVSSDPSSEVITIHEDDSGGFSRLRRLGGDTHILASFFNRH